MNVWKAHDPGTLSDVTDLDSSFLSLKSWVSKREAEKKQAPNYTIGARPVASNADSFQAIGNVTTNYSQCRQWEADINRKVADCEDSCNLQQVMVATNCAKVGPGCNEPLVCTAKSWETYPSYLERKIAELEALSGLVWNATHRCEVLRKNVSECYKQCDDIAIPITSTDPLNIGPCCVKRTAAETDVCQWELDRMGAYQNYSQCHLSAVTNYQTVFATQDAAARTRQSQMASLLKLLCYVVALTHPDPVFRDAAISNCSATNFFLERDVQALVLAAQVMPTLHDRPSCRRFLPGTQSFDSRYYGDLPEGLSPCPAVHCEAACNVSSYGAIYKPVANVSVV